LAKPLSIYVAATRQNDGKTVTALGLVLALQKRFHRVGYIKPVGQHYLEVDGARIDKDSVLVQRAASLSGSLGDMSPVAVPRGFTEHYIDEPHREDLEKRILEGFERVSRDARITVIEGTGHAGVGSVFDLSNADVARLLDAPVLIVSAGGIGRPIDEVMLNKAVFDQKGVPIAGVVINKVQTSKYEKINRYVRKGMERHGLNVWGVFPYDPMLSAPSIEEIQQDLDARVLSGEDNLKAQIRRFVIGAMRAHEVLDWFGKDSLLITPGNREDLILSVLSLRAAGREYGMTGIVLTCGIEPHPSVLELISATDLPVLLVESDTFETASRISDLIVKVRASDTEKIAEIERITEKHLDLDGLVAWLEEHHS
jgi:BioD-like phosphotransacetylase family protein